MWSLRFNARDVGMRFIVSKVTVGQDYFDSLLPVTSL
jgi:hypothetical protein